MICNNCGAAFDEPQVLSEPAGEYFGTPVHVEISICPVCGSDDIEESGKCPICGEAMKKTDDYCSGCVDWIQCAVHRFILDVQNHCDIGYDTALEYITQEIERRNL